MCVRGGDDQCEPIFFIQAWGEWLSIHQSMEFAISVHLGQDSIIMNNHGFDDWSHRVTLSYFFVLAYLQIENELNPYTSVLYNYAGLRPWPVVRLLQGPMFSMHGRLLSRG